VILINHFNRLEENEKDTKCVPVHISRMQVSRRDRLVNRDCRGRDKLVRHGRQCTRNRQGVIPASAVVGRYLTEDVVGGKGTCGPTNVAEKNWSATGQYARINHGTLGGLTIRVDNLIVDLLGEVGDTRVHVTSTSFSVQCLPSILAKPGEERIPRAVDVVHHAFRVGSTGITLN
jgi:hypothetical protein